MDVTCLPPTNCATEARSVSDVATFRSANAGVAPVASTAIDRYRNRIKDFIATSWKFRSIGMGGVISDRVAHLDHDSIVGRMNSGVRLGVAVLEPHERELRGHPGDVGGASRDAGRDEKPRVVDHEIREAL